MSSDLRDDALLLAKRVLFGFVIWHTHKEGDFQLLKSSSHEIFVADNSPHSSLPQLIHQPPKPPRFRAGKKPHYTVPHSARLLSTKATRRRAKDDGRPWLRGRRWLSDTLNQTGKHSEA